MDIEKDFKTSDSGLVQVNPEVSLNEQNSFINQLRNMPQGTNAQIDVQTRNLGSDLPDSRGGLGGATNAFVAQEQVPKTSKMVNDLRATAQAQALSTALANIQADYQRKYKQAYSSYVNARNAKQDSYYNNNGNSDKETPLKTAFDKLVENYYNNGVSEQEIGGVPYRVYEKDGEVYIQNIVTGDECKHSDLKGD